MRQLILTKSVHYKNSVEICFIMGYTKTVKFGIIMSVLIFREKTDGILCNTNPLL